jgi:phosphatidylinositol 4-kinase A
MKNSISHPMARELRLRIILFSLRVLRVSTGAGTLTHWRLKDKILSAGLSWFKFIPKWSFGSNILQIKTEVRLISDVQMALKGVAYIAAHPVGSYKALQQKEQLLHILLESEQARLSVWVHPLGDIGARPDIMTHHGQKTLEVGRPSSYASYYTKNVRLHSIP